MLVTPLQMAMVAATVANGGVLMQPHLVEEVVARRTARRVHEGEAAQGAPRDLARDRASS